MVDAARFSTALGLAFVLATLSPQANAQSAARISSPGLRTPPTPEPSSPDDSQRKPRNQQPDYQQSAEPTEQPNSAEVGPSLEEGGKLNLMCFGGGAATKMDMTSAYGWNSFGYSSTATVIGSHDRGFEDQVNLFIQGTEGKVRMPRTMLPLIRGGEDGWFKLHDLKIKENEITGSVGVNAFNNPKIRLDRYTGAISISGKAGDFAGRCRRFDPGSQRRAF